VKPELKLVEDTGSQLEADQFLPPPQQSEMPFAMVEGERVTEMPKDLYIPPDALQVFLDAFEGPLDLLLYLIRRQNLDILDIPIAEITRQYMKYIDVMAEMQLELAGEYLLMAAMLAEIKSRMLLPRPPSPDSTDEEDPRAELVRRLQEYERFKKAAEDIDQLSRMERDTISTSVELVERKIVRAPPQVSLQEMLIAFKDVLSRADMFAHHHVNRERLSVRQRMSDILSSLRDTAFMDFGQLFRPEEGRMGVTVTFIAILELMKEGLIEIVQSEPYAPIHIRPAAGSRHLALVGNPAAANVDPDAENAAALAQPAFPDEDADLEEPAEVLEDIPDEVLADIPGETGENIDESVDEIIDAENAVTGAANESSAVNAAVDAEVTPATDTVTSTAVEDDTPDAESSDDPGKLQD